MKGRRGRLAKYLSIPVLAACGFVLAATAAGGGVSDVLDGTTTPTPAPTTRPSSPPVTPTLTPTTVVPTTTPMPSPTVVPSPTPTVTPPPSFEGCGHGFWKKPSRAWTGFSRDQTVGAVFTGLPPGIASLTLSDALTQGGGGLNALIRQAIAALLNAENSEVDYPLTTAQVVDMVDDAVANGDEVAIDSLKDTLDGFNNLGASGTC
jgi:hypothetical protein